MEVTDTPSRQVNLWRKPRDKNAPALYDRLDGIQTEVEGQETRRKRGGKSADCFRQCLRAISLDLFHAYVEDFELQVGVPRDKSALSSKDPALPDFVTARTFLDALDGLIATGFVEQDSVGNEASGLRTRVRGTKKLADQLGLGGTKPEHLIDTSDTIILRVGPKKKRKRVGFEDTSDTNKWRCNLERINNMLSEYRTTLDINPVQVLDMEATRLDDARQEAAREGTRFNYRRINTRSVRLYRVFNSRDWSEGGRFYGGWWQSVPKRFRPHIQINGKQTCEYDYSSIHPRLLYQRIGLPLPEDVDPYGAVFDGQHRDAVKRAFNAMLNANRLPQPVPEFSTQETGLTWKQFTDAILEHHEPLRHFMNTGEGLRLQRLDADIAEAVMLKFVDMRQPCLPVHDSFITYQTLEDELPDIMSGVIDHIGAGSVPPKLSYSAEYQGATGLVSADIGELLTELDSEEY